MALRRLLALAAAATVAADVVQVAVLCNYIEARIADRQDCDAIIAAVDAINDKEDGVLDGLLLHSAPGSSWSRVSNVAWYARWLRQSNKPINDRPQP